MGICMDMEIPKTPWQNEGSLVLGTKEKLGVEYSMQRNTIQTRRVIFCWQMCMWPLGSSDTWRTLTKQACWVPPCLPHKVHVLLSLSVLRALFLHQMLGLHSFTWLRVWWGAVPESAGFQLLFHSGSSSWQSGPSWGSLPLTPTVSSFKTSLLFHTLKVELVDWFNNAQ